MDRLSALILAAAAAAACGLSEPAVPPSRVEGAKVSARPKASTDAFCDFHAADDHGPALTIPPLAGALPPPAANHWRWVNVWATWCKPCVEEMPLLQRWHDKLATAGHSVDLAFVSIDESDTDVAAFRKLHPDAPESARLVEPAKQTAWFSALGLDAGSPIPIHVLASPAGHVRCARAGGIREQDYAAIVQLLSE
jgi:thiol-disulfide isomerase/thioredoxin